VLVVYAHPDPESFTAFVRDRVVATLTHRGHDVDLLDLYDEGFAPEFTMEDLHAHDHHTKPPVEIVEHVERLRRARALVLVYPTWYGGPPAMLKGWFDRVFTAAVPVRNIRRLAVVTVHGSSKPVNAIGGEPGKRMIFRTLRVLCHPLAHPHWIALYGVDRATDADRGAFLARVERRVNRL
jgi:putative NADPH-quinone reductase